jgi:prevent-host-death family protein
MASCYDCWVRTIGIFEAKNRFSELVSDVEHGDRILLTRNGRPVAEIVPATEEARQADAAMDWIRSRRWKLGGLSIRRLVNEGRH